VPDPGAGPTCDTAGVIMPITSIIASIQTTEALKLPLDAATGFTARC
jgi:hypothetical protein